MGRRLRYFEADGRYFVTARTFQSRLLLRPDSSIATILGGVLAKAAEKYEVEIYGFVAASNHVHLLCRARDGSLSSFMQYFLANASKKVGPAVDWQGQMWERRYAAEPVLDDAAMEGRLRYILSHGVKEGLVDSPHDWPGLSCLPQLVGDAVRTFPFFNWSRRWRSGALVPGAEDRYSRQWADDVELRVAPLPHWERLSEEERRRRIQEMVSDIEAEHRLQPKMGVVAVLLQDPHHRLKSTSRSPQPWCHATDSEARRALKKAYRAFAAAYRVASARFRSGDFEAAFPPLAFRPIVRPGVSCTRPATNTPVERAA